MFSDDVIQICSMFRNDDLFIAPGIPNDKLISLSFSVMMPPNTKVFALIDTTVFGSAKNGMLITDKGLYFHNDSTANMPGSYFLSWKDFWQTNNSMFPLKVELGELALTPLMHFEFTGCSMNADQIIPLLMNLRTAYGKYAGMQNAQPVAMTPPPAQPKQQIKCQFCNSIFDGDLQNCPNCGAAVSQQKIESPSAQPYPAIQSPVLPQNQLFPTAQKSRTVYVILSLLFGCLGIHNFYAGRVGEGIFQLLLTILTMGLGIVVTVPWALINIFTVKTDVSGNPLV